MIPSNDVGVYRSLRTDDLVLLRHAFMLDRRRAVAHGNRDTVAFCDARIKTIDAVLIERTPAPCTAYRPDHNGECMNCDEPADAHDDTSG